MTHINSKRTSAILLIVGIIGFYAIGSAAVLQTATFDYISLKESSVEPFATAYELFLIWIATSYTAIALCVVMILVSVRALRNLSEELRRVGILTFAILSVISIAALIASGNAILITSSDTLCLSKNFCTDGFDATPMSVSGWTKTVLNGAFQVAAIGLLSGFIFSLSDNSKPERNESETIAAEAAVLADKQNSNIYLFYFAAVLLTLIVLTDILFFEFVSKMLPADSTFLVYQKGFVDFFAIISSATLVLALAAGVGLGLKTSGEDLKKVGGEKALASIGAFINSASMSRSFAAMAPIIVTLISSFAG